MHRINEQLFYEIPKAELGKDFLWVSQIKRAAAGAGARRPAGRQPRRALGAARQSRAAAARRLQHRRRSRRRRSRAPSPTANNPAIVRAFNVAAFSPAGDPVIEVTPLFLTDVPELSVRGRIGARGSIRAGRSSKRSSRFRRTSTSR